MPAVLDMQQVYDMWLTLNSQTRQADVAMNTQPIPQEKYIVMPTDYAEQMVGTLLFFRFCVFFPWMFEEADDNVSFLRVRPASTAVCVVGTVTASGSGSSTSPLRNTRTECSAVRKKMKPWSGATVSLAHALNSAPSKTCSCVQNVLFFLISQSKK